jgi:hypothetical protein
MDGVDTLLLVKWKFDAEDTNDVNDIGEIKIVTEKLERDQTTK